jgi:hypothetical protein
MPAMWLPSGIGPREEVSTSSPGGRHGGGKDTLVPRDNTWSVPAEVVLRGGKYVAVRIDQLTHADRAWLAGAELKKAPHNGNLRLKKAS